ncbi:hypothetical protein ODZ84_07710 [Chryseobacterium fluminis]|uniref:hypothetical protein n=1 Tax=Chryseobacterium fluminis TaxID=2983606 RepID=UPI00225413A1|nr:hypothetical protein [Chryseobacterium sp. MMS21-Ot14]UZT99439.1 hypothetical protein ODZ84_07710 [Chryseobacterium sp. MMS21-Ot14]
MTLYHLSYDVKNCESDFKNDHNKARKFLLCVLASSNFHQIYRYTESTFLIIYKDFEPDKFFGFIEKNLIKYFYYSVSVVSINEENKYITRINGNKQLHDSLQEEITKIDCSNLDKPITDY